MRGPREAGCWWGAECNLPDATPDTLPPARGFHLLSRQRAGNFTIARFGSATPVAFDTCSATFRSGARFRGTRPVSVIVLVQRLPQRDPADPEPAGQFPLGGQPVTRRVDAQLDPLEEPLDGLLEGVSRPDRAEYRGDDGGRPSRHVLTPDHRC